MMSLSAFWSRFGRVKIFFLALAACGLAGIIYLSYHHRTATLQRERHEISRHHRPKARHQIRGFRFDGTHEGKKTICIKADKFSIEKKKLGFFRFSLLNVARFRNVVIDIYGQRIEPVRQAVSCADSAPSQTIEGQGQGGDKAASGLTFKHIFSRQALPSFPVKRISSVVMNPVRLKLHDEKSVVTQISADSATIRLKKRDILFRGNVRVLSGQRSLTTGELSMFPDKGVIRTHGHFILKTPQKQLRGEGLTTDIFLKSRTHN